MKSKSIIRALVLTLYLALVQAPVPPLTGSASPLSQTASDPPALEVGKPLERELAGGQAHAYRLTLTSGQYLHLIVEQLGIDIVVAVFGPDGGKLAEVDSPNGQHGPEPVSLVAEVPGSYRLEVRSLEKEAAAGRYEAKIAELRVATAQDRTHIAAERAFTEGIQLQAKNTEESLRRAIGMYEAALVHWRAVGDRGREVSTLNYIGYAYTSLNEPQRALDHYLRALPLYRAAGDRRGEANVLRYIGSAYYELSEYQKALDYYLQALPLWRAAGDHSGEASTLSNIGIVYYYFGEYQKALDYYLQALPLRRVVGDGRGEANTLSNIGALYQDLGENQKALEHFLQALTLRRAAGDRGGEGVSLHNIGTIYYGWGDTQKALDYLHQSLPLRRAARDRSGEAHTLNYLGGIYNDLGNGQKALDYYLQALALQRAVGDRNGEASTLSYIGSAYSDLGEKQKALELYLQALALYRAVGERSWEGIALDKIGTVYHDLGQRQKALEYFNQALALQRAIGNRRFENVPLRNIGNVYHDLGEHQKALDHYLQALALCRETGNRGGEAMTLYRLARAERDRGNLEEARTHIEAALNLIESLRTKVASQELRASYLASRQSYYEFDIDLLMRLHQGQPSKGLDALALQTSERARARSLLETLSEARADIRQGVDPALLERERGLQQQLNAKEQARMQLLGRKPTPEQAAAAEKELRELAAQYQEIQAQIRTQSPRYAALTQPQPLGRAEIQRQVLDSDTLLLEYALGDERSYLWAVSSEAIASFELPKRAEVEAAARGFYDLVTAPNQLSRAAGPPQNPGGAKEEVSKQRLVETAAELSRMLLSPVASQLGTKRLLIVADGALQYLPFAALPIPEAGRQREVETGPSESPRPAARRPSAAAALTPLIVEHEVVTLPSASTLAVLRRETAERKTAPKALAILADPVFSSDDSRVKRSQARVEEKPGGPPAGPTRTRASEEQLERSVREAGVADGLRIPRLPGTRREAAGILALVPEEERKQALDFEASRATVTGPELAQYRIIHFATHGLLNSLHPELSGVVLSLIDAQGQSQDGFLRLHEIYNLKLPAELVVLSACQTGLGKEIKGEGLVGLTRGFMYAGAPRVVASLWKVDDKATAELMKHFYQGMVGEQRLRPAAALRAAQVAMWKTKSWKDPYYWAAFVLQGEWK
jgi:CHAT domain-containing protein/Tfp pilus assembly protein PilF